MQLPYPARRLGQRLLRGVPVRVRSGVNEGRRWSLVTAGRGCASGRFGRRRLEALAALVRPGECLWDLGAHKGFVTLAAARMVGPGGTVVAVEPGRSNLSFLRQHLAWNGVGNVRVVEAAVSDRVGRGRFGGRGDSLGYRLGRGGEEVDVRTVADLVERETLPPPTAWKIDIEGEEVAALRGADDLLRGDAVLLVSVHSRPLHAELTELLAERGFRLFESAEMAARTARPADPWGGDHDLLAFGTDRTVDDAEVRALPLIAGG